jgi:serine/threonine protein phosphatase PrpC
MISHVLGAPHRLKDLDFSEFFLGDGYLVLCSDGLTQVLKKEAIGIIIGKNDGNLETACEEMVNEAMTAGSESTITVILVHGTV